MIKYPLLQNFIKQDAAKLLKHMRVFTKTVSYTPIRCRQIKLKWFQ